MEGEDGVVVEVVVKRFAVCVVVAGVVVFAVLGRERLSTYAFHESLIRGWVVVARP